MKRIFMLFAIAAMLMILVIVPIAALAQGIDPAEEITLGGYAIPPLITLGLMFIFNFFAFPDRWKPLIAIGLGIGLSILAIPYLGKVWTVVIIVDHTLYGMMAGCAAVGLYEGQKAFRKCHRI